jgi:hypothetical protein
MNESNKKVGRPKMLTHRNPNFGVSLRNDSPVLLERPVGLPVLTNERFQYLIKMQPVWRHEYLKQKPTITNYSLNKQWFKEYNLKYRQEKKLDHLYEENQKTHSSAIDGEAIIST